MNLLLKEIQHNKLFRLLVFVPVVFAAHNLKHDAHTLLFVLSVLAIVPLSRPGSAGERTLHQSVARRRRCVGAYPASGFKS